MEKYWKIGRFSARDTAGLGKYSTGGYGRIGVYRVKHGEGGGYKMGKSRV